MALDEFLFHRFIRFWQGRKDRLQATDSRVTLGMLSGRLTLLARMLSGRPIDIFPAIREGGRKGDRFFLPPTVDLFGRLEDNAQFYLFRVVYMSVLQEIEFPACTQIKDSEEQSRSISASHAPLVLAHLEQKWPEAYGLYTHLLQAPRHSLSTEEMVDWLRGRWMWEDEVDKISENTHTVGSIDTKQSLEVKTTRKAKAVESIEVLKVDVKQQEEYVLTHNFEKVETADEFSGSWRNFDGSDQLEDHEEALRELNMRFVVRANEITHSVYEAGYRDGAQIADSAELENHGVYFEYDEWHHYQKAYRKAFCKLYEMKHRQFDSQYYHDLLKRHRGLIERLRKALSSVHQKWTQMPDQLQGDTISLERSVDRFVDLYTGHHPEERVYKADRRQSNELSILLLLDLSLSSDSYVDGNRILDIEKQTALIFGDLLDEQQVPFAIHGFYSQTRNYTAFVRIKDFETPWHSAKHWVGSLQPRGYTRIGASLRHAGAILKAQGGKHPWVILLTDGKPNDFDRYEGVYGMEDVRKALRELKSYRVQSYALAVEANAKFYLPRLFGKDHFQLVGSMPALVDACLALFTRIRYHHH